MRTPIFVRGGISGPFRNPNWFYRCLRWIVRTAILLGAIGVAAWHLAEAVLQ